ncbi:unnamed protein product [Closterium sp. Yama58-4]|nr:unnamed protein product [Closterium sp. Yama58-4]
MGCADRDESIAAIERSIEQQVQQIMAHKMLMATTGSGDSSSVDPPRWLPAAHADSAAQTPSHSARCSQPALLSSAPGVAACHGGSATRLFHPWVPRETAHHGVQFGIREPMVVWSPYSAQLYMHPPALPALAPNFPGMAAPPPLPPLRPCPPPVPQHSPPLSQWSAGPSTASAKSAHGPTEHTGALLDTQPGHCDAGVNCGERTGVVMPARCAAPELLKSRVVAPSAASAVACGMAPPSEAGANDADLSMRCTPTWEAVAERMSAPAAQGMTQGVAEGGLLGEGDDISAWLSRLVGGTAGPGLPDAPTMELTQLQGNEATRGHAMLTSAGVASCGSGTAASAGRGTAYSHNGVRGDVTRCDNVPFNNPMPCNSLGAMPAAPAPAYISARALPSAQRHPAPAPPATQTGGGAMGEQRGEWGRRGVGEEESDEGGGVEEERCMEGMTVEQILQERRKRSRQRRQQLLSHLESDATKLKAEREQLRSKLAHAANRLTQLQERQKKLEHERDTIKAEIEAGRKKMNNARRT